MSDCLTLCIRDTGKQVLWQTVKTLMSNMAAFHPVLHCLLGYDAAIFRDRNTTQLEISTCVPLKYKMDNSIHFLSTCMGKSIRMKRVMGKYDYLPWSLGRGFECNLVETPKTQSLRTIFIFHQPGSTSTSLQKDSSSTPAISVGAHD